MSTNTRKTFSQHLGAPPEFEATLNRAAHEFAASIPMSTPRDLADDAVRRVMGAIRAQALRKPELWQASALSLGRAMALSVITGLMPGGPLPEVDLIPRKKRTKDADGRWSQVVDVDWQVGFRGYLSLARRSGVHVSVPQVVYQHEYDDPERFDWQEGLDRQLRHRPKVMEGGLRGGWDGVVLLYVVVVQPGMKDFFVMTREEIEARRSRSEAWRNLVAYEEAMAAGTPPTWPNGDLKPRPDCPWADWPVEMAQKTILRAAAARGLLPFNDLGIVAYEHDSRMDVMDATEVVQPAGAVAPRSRPAALPDHDPLGLDGAQEREREPVPVAREEELGEAEQQQDIHQPDRFARSDAEVLLAKLGENWKAPVSEERLTTLLKGGLGVSRLRPSDRLGHAISYCVNVFGCRWENNHLLPRLEGE